MKEIRMLPNGKGFILGNSDFTYTVMFVTKYSVRISTDTLLSEPAHVHRYARCFSAMAHLLSGDYSISYPNPEHDHAFIKNTIAEIVELLNSGDFQERQAAAFERHKLFMQHESLKYEIECAEEKLAEFKEMLAEFEELHAEFKGK